MFGASAIATTAAAPNSRKKRLSRSGWSIWTNVLRQDNRSTLEPVSRSCEELTLIRLAPKQRRRRNRHLAMARRLKGLKLL